MHLHPKLQWPTARKQSASQKTAKPRGVSRRSNVKTDSAQAPASWFNGSFKFSRSRPSWCFPGWCLLGGARAFEHFQDESRPDDVGKVYTVSIDEDNTPDEIAQLLEDNGLINSKTYFTSRMRVVNSELEPGSYRITKGMSVGDIIDTITGKATSESNSSEGGDNSDTSTLSITVIEGWRTEQIADELVNARMEWQLRRIHGSRQELPFGELSPSWPIDRRALRWKASLPGYLQLHARFDAQRDHRIDAEQFRRQGSAGYARPGRRNGAVALSGRSRSPRWWSGKRPFPKSGRSSPTSMKSDTPRVGGSKPTQPFSMRLAPTKTGGRSSVATISTTRARTTPIRWTACLPDRSRTRATPPFGRCSFPSDSPYYYFFAKADGSGYHFFATTLGRATAEHRLCRRRCKRTRGGQ